MLNRYLANVKRFKKEKLPIPEGVFEKPLYFIAFGFGAGIIPFAPGTFGTLVALFLYMLLPPLSFASHLVITLFVIIISIYICDRVSKEIKLHDHPGMCLDEFPGFFVSMLFAPVGFKGLLIAFILFRLFDIVKPWPINWIDKNVHGGFGMVLDDVIAGVFVSIIFILLSCL